jgi:DNA-binding transcriptional LysR family regulator
VSIALKQLEAFVAVADLASFSRAGERLNTTQPNISSRIAALEQRLDATLLDRSGGQVRLTSIGERLLPHARRVLADVDILIEAAGNDHLFEGVLRLGVSELVAHTWLGDLLKALKVRFPNVLVELRVDLSTNISQALFDRSIDLALQSGPFQRPSTGMMDLGRFPMTWVVSPDYLTVDGAISTQALVEHTILMHARGTIPYDQIVEHFSDIPGRRLRLAPSTSLAACLQMTRDGLGVACLPVAMVAADFHSGDLVELPYHWRPDDLTFHARFDTAAANHFVREAAAMAAEAADRSS